MTAKPFENMDGREARTLSMRNAAYALLGGESSYNSASYMMQSLACKAASLNWVIENGELTKSEFTQANNAYLGICKKLDPTPIGRPPLGAQAIAPEVDVYDAIRTGVKEAIWEIASDNVGTDVTSALYFSIQEGVQMAIGHMLANNPDALRAKK